MQFLLEISTASYRMGLLFFVSATWTGTVDLLRMLAAYVFHDVFMTFLRHLPVVHRSLWDVAEDAVE